jgi:hypothetical protein
MALNLFNILSDILFNFRDIICYSMPFNLYINPTCTPTANLTITDQEKNTRHAKQKLVATLY